ncbi:MAG: hypothetical protein JRJ69_00885 [Deltaproteobacteria bacterium]|nr:hypothetical protein [Deltaproteobacteria bacterium]
MSEMLRRPIPWAVFIFSTFWIFFEFFLKIPGGPAVTSELSRWVTCVVNFSILLGALNLIKINAVNITKKKEGEWIHGIVILGSLAIMFLAGIVYKPVFTWCYDNIYIGLNVALMCFVGFYYYSAMYRTFKVRTPTALVTLLACISMLFANAPISGAIWGPLPEIGSWVASVPGMGAWRGFIMSAALGMFAMAIRAALGIERGYIGEKRE